jgi:glutaredoxin-like YruB-family protein
MAKTKTKVRVYSTAICPWCHTVKEWLREHKIDFEEVDVGADQKAAKEMIEKSGQMGVPVVEIDGQIVVGFDEEKLRHILKIKD